MNILFPILFFALPLAIAFKLCGWEVVAAFIITIIVVPFFIVFLSHLIGILFYNKEFDPKGCIELGAIFAIPGIPIYFIGILPLYYLMRSIDFPLYISFPCCISAIMLILAILIAERPLSYLHYLMIIACSFLHSLLIAWLIAKFKSFSF